MGTAVVALASLVCTLAAQGAAAETALALRIPGVGTLALAVPDGWGVSLQGGAEGRTPTVKLSAETGERFSVLVTPVLLPPPARRELLAPGGLRAFVQLMADKLAPTAVEKSLELEAIGGGSEGFLFAATDRAPKPGEFTHVTQGAIATGDRVASYFTILTNGPRSPIVPRALGMLRGMRVDAVADDVPAKVASLERLGETFRITLPDGRGVLTFPAGGFRIEQADDARPYYFVVDRESGLNASFSIEAARECTSSKACRDLYAEKLKGRHLNWRDWTISQEGDVFFSEATDTSIVLGLDLQQRHVNAHYVVNGVWIDVHLSKVRYGTADRPLFVRFIKAIRAEPAP